MKPKSLSVEQVLSLAPDAASCKNGRAQASERKWPQFGRCGDALWGLCQGSGATPYQVRIDLIGPAFKCSCPSFKIPCKHSLGLMFLYAEKPELFSGEKACDFLAEWLTSRQQRAEQKERKQEEQARSGPPNPGTLAKRQSAQVRRSEAREDKVAAGIEELSLFLRDLVRHGLAHLAGKPYSYWDGMAARLVDAQAPGLARQVAALASVSHAGSGWQTEMLQHLGQLHLACEAWKRQERLPEGLRADYRALLGFSTPQEEVQNSPGSLADWAVLAQSVTEQDKVKLARTWCWDGVTRRAAVVYQYAFAGQLLSLRYAPGCLVRTEMVFHASASPWRALFKEESPAEELPFAAPAGLSCLDSLLSAFSAELAANPWCERRAFLLNAAIPLSTEGDWLLQDAESPTGAASPRRAVRMQVSADVGWTLLALSGGHPLRIFGEWNGSTFLPLSAFDPEGQIHNLAARTELSA